MPSDVDVIIIGAGAAGLAAAKELGRLGLTYTLAEGAERIGGRAYTKEIAPDVWFDMGCAWLVGGASNPFTRIADELGIGLDKNHSHLFQEANHRFQRNGTPLNEDQRAACRAFYEESYQAILAAAQQGRDVALSDVVDQNNDFAPPFLYNVATGWGRDVDHISTADFASATGELGFQAPHGYGNLVAAWGADVAVSLNTRVERIDWSGHGVVVETSQGTLIGRTVLSTVSTGVLAADGIVFTPSLPNWKTAAINGLPMGVENRIGVYFEKELFGVDGRGHYTTWNDDGTAAKLDVSVMGFKTAVVFVGGRHAIGLEKQGQQACHAFALDRIADIFGNAVHQHVKHSLITGWSMDPWTRGAWSCALPGQAHQRANLQRPVADRLFFAGEATVYGGQGTCHGAYQSGIQAAQEIAALLNGV
ncbi:MAG: NAD(P)/FAD-dependent oxidoreductase [Chloroflexota bacterium]